MYVSTMKKLNVATCIANPAISRSSPIWSVVPVQLPLLAMLDPAHCVNSDAMSDETKMRASSRGGIPRIGACSRPTGKMASANLDSSIYNPAQTKSGAITIKDAEVA